MDSAGAYQGISCGTDTITPVWSGSAVVTLNASSALDFRLVDSDDVGCGLTTNTGACDFAFSGMALRDLICEGGYDGSVANVAMCEGMSVTFDVDPL